MTGKIHRSESEGEETRTVLETDGGKQVVVSTVNLYSRSSVFMCMNHRYETMVFPASIVKILDKACIIDCISSYNALDSIQCDTYEQSLVNHKDMVERWLNVGGNE